jgi:4-methyl-5(b-hydroxyethyl)-thiazole monophosphate biosynthesis
MKTLIILAHGFEETEAVAVIDVLRRAKIEVVIAGLDYPTVTSARQITVIADTELKHLKNDLFDAIILPGGEPGTTYLEASATVAEMLQRHYAANKLIAAICAAPRILDKLGFLTGRKATSFPGAQPEMTHCTYREEAVVVEDNIITSRGPGTALYFGLAIVSKLHSPQLAQELRKTMMIPPQNEH